MFAVDIPVHIYHIIGVISDWTVHGCQISHLNRNRKSSSSKKSEIFVHRKIGGEMLISYTFRLGYTYHADCRHKLKNICNSCYFELFLVKVLGSYMYTPNCLCIQRRSLKVLGPWGKWGQPGWGEWRRDCPPGKEQDKQLISSRRGDNIPRKQPGRLGEEFGVTKRTHRAYSM
jgi:hypothetical protein